MKIYNVEKDKSLCQSTFFICNTKMLILLSFTIVQYYSTLSQAAQQ